MRASLPHNLTKLTAEQVEWCVAYHVALPLGEIRRRQELTDRQIGMAWQQRNGFALGNLRVREEILRRAVEGRDTQVAIERDRSAYPPQAVLVGELVPEHGAVRIAAMRLL